MLSRGDVSDSEASDSEMQAHRTSAQQQKVCCDNMESIMQRHTCMHASEVRQSHDSGHRTGCQYLLDCGTHFKHVYSLFAAQVSQVRPSMYVSSYVSSCT